MAEKKYSIGDQVFEREEDYLAAKDDLGRIKNIMAAYDLKTRDGAKAALDSLENEPDFMTDYGRKFVERLEKTAGAASERTARAAKEGRASGKSVKAAETTKKAVDTVQGKKVKKTGSTGIHIVTFRNILIVGAFMAVIIAGVTALKHFGKSDTVATDDAKRKLVMGYAGTQVSLKADLYNYYHNVQGESDAKAKELADTDISEAYAMDVSVLDLENMDDEYIDKIYTTLITAGDIENGAYNEPEKVTALKEKIRLSTATNTDAADTGENGITYEETENAEDSLKVNLINRMMDYQQRIATALTYEYSHFGLEDSEVSEYVIEDMEQMFVKVIYDLTLTEEEKIMYFDTFASKNFFSGGDLVRFGTDPAVYELPDLTPSVYLVTGGEKIRLTCIQESVAPVYSVAYRLTDGKSEGYLVFRSNENMSVVLTDDSGNGTYIQGDVLLNWGGETTIGEWYMNNGKIGFAIGDDLGDGVEYIYEIVY